MDKQRRLEPQGFLDRLRQEGPVIADGLELVGVGQEQVEEVARGAVGRLGAGRQQQTQERVDRLVRQPFAVDLGQDQVADDVFLGIRPAQGYEFGEVIAERL